MKRPVMSRAERWVRQEAIVAAVRAGGTNTKVAAEYGVTPAWVSQLARRAGIVRSPSSPTISDRERRNEIARLLAEGATPVTTIMQRYGLSRSRVYQIAKQDRRLAPLDDIAAWEKLGD